MRRFASLLSLSLALMLACVDKQPPPPPPPPGGGSRSLTVRDAEPAEPRDGFADIASEPAHVWFGHRGQDIVRIILVGHADPECCSTLSGMVAAALATGFLDGHAYNGFFDVRATERAESLPILRFIFDEFHKVRGGVCEKQLYIHNLDDAKHEHNAEVIRKTAERAYSLADVFRRPIMVWHDNLNSAPHFAPVLVPARDGGLESLELELGIAELDLPRSLTETPPEVRKALQATDKLIRDLKRLESVLAELRMMARGNSDLAVIPDWFKVDASQSRTAITALRGYNRCLEQWRSIWQRLDRAAADFKIPDDTPARTLVELADFVRQNEKGMHMLAKIGERGEASFPVVRCEKINKGYSAAERRKFAVLDIRPVLDFWKTQADSTRQIIKTAIKYDVNLMVDAGLRGLNISLGDGESNTEEATFDVWMAKVQLRLWRRIRAKAHGRGVEFGSHEEPAGVLQASNLILRTRRVGDRVRIAPHFVLSGPFYQVVDPVSGMVYYESAIAEHNLKVTEN